MFALEVRDHIMIAHSLPGEAFGPAQNLHGATFVVDAAFFVPALGANDFVVDIGLASDALKAILAPLNYKNLDDMREFKSQRSTTEVLCKVIFDRLVEACRAGRLGDEGKAVARIRVTLGESHVARAWYEADLA